MSVRQILPLVFIALASCSSTWSQSTDHSANGRELNGAFTSARAMTLIYGSFDHAEGVSKWNPKPTASYPRSWAARSIRVTLVLNASFVESGLSRHLLVTTAIPNEGSQGEFTCHSCGTLIGFALFTKTSAGWRIDASDLQFGEYGAFGNPPPLSLQPIGRNRYGITITTSFGSTGEWEQSVTIIIPADGKFLKAFSAQTGGSDDWDCSRNTADEKKNSCVAYDGDINMLPAPRSEYFDLLLSKRVYRSFSTAQPVGSTFTRYHFNGSKYVPEK